MSKLTRDSKPGQPAAKPESLSDLSQPQHTRQGKQCPKCSYVRKLSDTAPDWQCPACKVAYYKVSAEYEEDQLQKAKNRSQRIADIEARRKRKKMSDLAGLAVLIGVVLATSGIGSSCNCGCVAPAVPPNLWLIGSGIAAMAGGFISWLGSQVSHLHSKKQKPIESP